MKKFWEENVRLTPTSITYGWIESAQWHLAQFTEYGTRQVCLWQVCLRSKVL